MMPELVAVIGAIAPLRKLVAEFREAADVHRQNGLVGSVSAAIYGECARRLEDELNAIERQRAGVGVEPMSLDAHLATGELARAERTDA